ncbi:nucleotidyltransferase [Gracilibacillus massiliensis]|uniref:nucleotidyltransferase n=1 Tax=Gracilibacillus massiliensis TaxID=1564956 RepID=UPI00071C85DD|nr:nucleotidyltransferase [Gracilibacillus massiliensis]
MKACGLIVEYNPYHNGHHYHFQQAKKITDSDCVIAVMSGNFLQRGEPAIIDKFSRAKIAVEQGIDLIVELPYYYAVQHSELFAKGAITILDNLQVDSICFGSEHGRIHDFIQMYQLIKTNQKEYDAYLKDVLNKGYSYPKANELAFTHIGGDQLSIDFTKPNNILGYQYVKNIYDLHSNIEPYTIKRIKNDYHDSEINDSIASATSIRKQLLHKKEEDINKAVPVKTREMIENYQEKYGSWHDWGVYFPILKYRILTMSNEELKAIHGMKEGIENRIREKAREASDFEEFMDLIKTKRYTWTSLQRIFANILTNTQKSTIEELVNKEKLPGIRVLAMSSTGQQWLNQNKKQIKTNIFTSNKKPYPLQTFDDRIDHAYYSILSPTIQQKLIKQSYQKPIFKTPE